MNNKRGAVEKSTAPNAFHGFIPALTQIGQLNSKFRLGLLEGVDSEGKFHRRVGRAHLGSDSRLTHRDNRVGEADHI